jgi:hypothetical protein
MGGKAVPQRVNTDALGNAGALRCDAHEPVELAPTHALSTVAGEQPGLAGMHPSLLARGAPPFAQYIEQVGRENDIPILFAPRFREGRLVWGLFVSSGFFSLSIAAVTARRVDRPQLLEIELSDGLQLVGQSRSFEVVRQAVEPRTVFVL